MAKQEVIELSNFKNFSQITKGVSIKAPKMTLLQNPSFYAKLLDDVQKEAEKDKLKVTHEDMGDHFLVSFK